MSGLPPTPLDRRWMSVSQAADYIGCSPQTIRTILRIGAIRASRPLSGTGPYVLDRLEIDRFLELRKRLLPPYRKGSRPWVAKRWAKRRRRFTK